MSDSYKIAALKWVREVLTETGMSPAEWARRANISPTTLTRPLNDANYPHALSGRTIAKLATALGRPPPHLAGVASERWDEFTAAPPATGEKPRRNGIVMIPEFELDARDLDAAGAAISYWPFDRDALARMELAPQALALFAIDGDLMAPTLRASDLVMIDRRDKRMGVGGLFALWDGEGVIFRRIDRAPGPRGAAPRLRLSVDSKLIDADDVEAAWIEPLGRVVMVVRRL